METPKVVYVFGTSSNPPGLHHHRIAKLLAEHADLVIVVPCGPRPDKLTTNDIPPVYRATMADMTFQGIPKVRVDLDDLERGQFMRSWRLLQRYEQEFPSADVRLAVGTDLLVGGKDGQSYIHQNWELGPQLWQEAKFVVITREGVLFDGADLPPHAKVLATPVSGSSTEIRQNVFAHQPITGLVTPEVEAYIQRYNLYRGMLPSAAGLMQIVEPRMRIVVDTENPRAVEMAKPFLPFADEAHPNGILVFGGDGFMLQTIRKYWRQRQLFIGFNAGHWGFLMNSITDVQAPEKVFQKLSIVQSPMLYVSMATLDGQIKEALAFNDCWTRSINGGQAAKTKVLVNGKVVMKCAVSDGLLVATAAGSTSYSRAMGAKALPVGSTNILLVGSNVFSPIGWHMAYLPLDDQIVLRTLEQTKRPTEAFVDGEPFGEIVEMRVRTSRIAAVELAYLLDHDFESKIREIQFPEISEE